MRSEWCAQNTCQFPHFNVCYRHPSTTIDQLPLKVAADTRALERLNIAKVANAINDPDRGGTLQSLFLYPTDGRAKAGNPNFTFGAVQAMVQSHADIAERRHQAGKMVQQLAPDWVDPDPQ